MVPKGKKLVEMVLTLEMPQEKRAFDEHIHHEINFQHFFIRIKSILHSKINRFSNLRSS
jgi:hypothetical protein